MVYTDFSNSNVAGVVNMFGLPWNQPGMAQYPPPSPVVFPPSQPIMPQSTLFGNLDAAIFERPSTQRDSNNNFRASVSGLDIGGSTHRTSRNDDEDRETTSSRSRSTRTTRTETETETGRRVVAVRPVQPETQPEQQPLVAVDSGGDNGADNGGAEGP